jgi:hypothetical protein
MDDISLVIGDGARRMTYAELAAVRGISPASAKRLAQRHRWGRQVGNDGVTRVTVPLPALTNPRKSAAAGVTATTEATSLVSPVTEIPAPAISSTTSVVTDPVTLRALEMLREQLERAEARVAYLDAERQRLFEMLLKPRGWRRWFR